MKKAKQLLAKPPAKKNRPTPTQAADFLEDYINMVHGKDEPGQPISIRIPANVLRSFKVVAKSKGLRYQSQIVLLMREWLKNASHF